MSSVAIRWALYEAPLHSNGVELKGYTREVLLCLAEHANKDGRNTYPSRQRIADELWGEASDQAAPVSIDAWRNKADTRVKRALRNLQQGGWIEEDTDTSARPFGARSKVWLLRLDMKREGYMRVPREGYTGVPREGYMHVPERGTPVSDKGYTGDPAGGTWVTQKGYTGVPLKGNKGELKGEEHLPTSRPDDSDTTTPTRPAWVHGTADDPRCERHADRSVQAPPCGSCARVRKWFDAHSADELDRARAERRAAIDACPLCDENGKREVPGGLARCDHKLKDDTPPWEIGNETGWEAHDFVAVGAGFGRGPSADAPF